MKGASKQTETKPIIRGGSTTGVGRDRLKVLLINIVYRTAKNNNFK